MDITDEDREITANSAGVMTIPAVATSQPTSSTRQILFHNSVLGGHQLHFSRGGGGQFEYTFDAPEAGQYHLTARVVTPTWKQSMSVSANEAEAIDIDLPFTVGMWEVTQPVAVELKKGENVLTFSREGNVMGITIRDFTLSPVSGAVSQR